MSCEAVARRRKLILDLDRAVGSPLVKAGLDVQGSEGELLGVFFELEGIVAEYTDGGDEMAEACTCGSDKHKRGLHAHTFDEMFAAFKNAVRHHQDRIEARNG